jgi:beta-D-xylosidase 4
VPSEDPLLNGDYGAAYTAGIQQGEDPRYIKVAVTLKHWDAYSL